MILHFSQIILFLDQAHARGEVYLKGSFQGMLLDPRYARGFCEASKLEEYFAKVDFSTWFGLLRAISGQVAHHKPLEEYFANVYISTSLEE